MANLQRQPSGVLIEYCGLGVWHLTGSNDQLRLVYPCYGRPHSTVLVTGMGGDADNPKHFAEEGAALRYAVKQCGGHIAPEQYSGQSELFAQKPHRHNLMCYEDGHLVCRRNV